MTPNVPMFESRMMRSFLALVSPPPNPSNRSARPSSCKAPVAKAATARPKKLAAKGCSPAFAASHNVPPDKAPMAMPTKGQARTVPARGVMPRPLSAKSVSDSGSSTTALFHHPGRGMRVKNSHATLNWFTSPAKKPSVAVWAWASSVISSGSGSGLGAFLAGFLAMIRESFIFARNELPAGDLTAYVKSNLIQSRVHNHDQDAEYFQP